MIVMLYNEQKLPDTARCTKVWAEDKALSERVQKRNKDYESLVQRHLEQKDK